MKSGQIKPESPEPAGKLWVSFVIDCVSHTCSPKCHLQQGTDRAISLPRAWDSLGSRVVPSPLPPSGERWGGYVLHAQLPRAELALALLECSSKSHSAFADRTLEVVSPAGLSF